MPESPRWLFMSGKHSEAVQAVKFLYGDSTDASIELITENCNTPSKNELSFREIFQPTVYKPALLSIALMFFQQFSGSNAVLYYTVSIFKQANSSVEPHMGNIFVAIIMFFFTLLSSCIMDSVGRKKCIFVSSLLMCLSLNALSTYLYLSNQNPVLKETLGWIPLLCLLVYIASFSIGLGPIPWLMMPEMSPLHARGLICGLGTAFSWIFVFIITKSFLEIESLVYDFGAYWIYSCFCFMCCFFSIFLLPETKGKTFEEIESHFAGGQPRLQRLQEIPNNRPTDLEG
ncbi:Facilitated trehalose transporter Tret1-1, partial [Stegodyphus mimosarum]